VISTLTAFGASAAAIDNLARLRAGGVRVLYGTDLGNTHPRGIDAAELAALGEAGLDGAAIVEAGTAAPAAFWGWSDRGLVAPGRVASFVVLGRDPSQHPGELSAPREVWIDGVRFDTAEP